MTQSNRWALSVVVFLVGLIVFGSWFFRAQRPVLSLYVWDGYFPAEVLADFEAESGARIKLNTYRSNDQMMARVKVSWSEFDVIMPSNYMLAEMRRWQLLERLSPEAVPNQRNISPAYYSPELGQAGDFEYGLPYMLNYAGIGYVPRLVAEPPSTWKEFFSSEFGRLYGDQQAVLNEPRETLGLALIGLGFSPNTENEAELQALRDFLAQQRSARGPPRFVLSEGRMLLETEEVALLSTWSPEITLAQLSNADLKYVMPQDGSILTIDTLAVPRSSRQKALAKQFIDFALRPENSRRVTLYSRYPNSLRDDLDDIPEALKTSPSYARPPPEKIYILQDLNEVQYLYDSIWVEYQD